VHHAEWASQRDESKLVVARNSNCARRIIKEASKKKTSIKAG